ncbi:TAXI family TRAP transporter solute-binding subunit [Piscinibacter gummiphilus]|uniref:TAXI family TRAP transporter solute-binding subunit n=1 Tax=Piscinibacter gummiphilus TaxID=946333 RepID=A0ABZ0CV33_9BURK|nr:TAXI family TRAP transporter solute-binding subunit [Piscinibacter gummiphilus]WOB06825.1 TAXI family TRAP transporter solute-binding subunit [Piscinibacter gummiphilus]
MPKVLRNTLLSARDLLVTAGPFLLLAVALLVLAYWVLDPTPPRKVVLATGVDQGAYAEFGKRYAQYLKQHGITVELRATNGANENLKLLRDPASGVDIAFVQGGADERDRRPADEEEDSLVSLGSLFYEPVWIFYREDSAQRLLKKDSLESLAQLPSWKLNIGARGSGVPHLMRRLLEANKIDMAAITILREAQTPAVQGLLEGRIDAITFASAPESLMVQMLLQTPGIRLFSFSQADAYSRRFAFLSPVTLPRGVVDLAADSPPADVHLVAPTATLVARQGTHPALIQLFVQAAQQIHGEAGWFQRKGDFPSIKGTERPLADEAQRYYAKGPPFLQRFLPFWVANLVDRMWVALVSIIAILIPLSRVVPPLYEFRIRSRVFRWYGRLRVVEDAQGKRPNEELLKELDDIEHSVEHVSVPLSYADELYALRSHIQLVRGRLTVTERPPA